MRYTPREIEMEFAAMAAQRQEQVRQIDLLAYLAGRYGMLAMHAPRKFPHAPNAIAYTPQPMSDLQMKRVFEHIAAARRDDHGDI